MIIDEQAIAKKLLNSSKLDAIAFQERLASFEEAKRQLLRDFNDHPVTREIEGGVGASNLSNTLGGQGNLFTFIGFPADSAPIKPVRDILENRLRIVKTGKRARGPTVWFYFKLLIPEDELREASLMPFESGNSWLFDIERGISGFSNYVYGKFGDASRSGGGIQSQFSHGGTFTPIPYIRELLKDFSRKLQIT